MGSQLDDALRAAAAVAAQQNQHQRTNTNANAQQNPTNVASPGRTNKKKHRKRRRSRSESLVSDDNMDPAQRMAAFHERLFNANDNDTPVTFAHVAGAGDDMVKVQWKGKKPTTNNKQSDNGEEIVPQVVKGKAARSDVDERLPPPPKKTHKLKGKKKKSAAPRVVEIHVPMATTSANKTTPMKRDDDALEFSDPSDCDDGGSREDAAASAKALVAARVAARKAVAGANKVVPSINLTATTGKKTGAVKQPQPSATAPINANGTSPVKKLVATRKLAILKQTTTKAPPKPAVTKAVKEDKQDDHDRFDLDAFVKNTVKKATRPRKASMSDDEHSDADGNDEDAEFVGKQFRDHKQHLFSALIDEAARERWELVEVGRLVRIFAAQWNHKKKKTARFLRRYCPELVSVDFLEGLNIPLTSQQLLKIFARGSGTPVVLMNKIASAVENENLSVHDEHVQSFLVGQTQPMATNREIIGLLMPLFESLSKVKDVGVVLKAICAHWHIDRTVALVQDVLLRPIFDDLDGQPDAILEDLPALEGRLDFPSRMDDEDADENGNLKGLIAGDDSDLGESDPDPEDIAEEELGDVLSDDADGDDSHAEDEVYEGETDSEEEREAHERLNPSTRRRSRFILDEADEDEDDEDGEDEDGFLDAEDDESEDDESEDSGSDSSSEDDASTKPQRKRLRRGH